jgi:hypothetical protein
MIFIRSLRTRTYLNYTKYRPFLRQDFRFRCAYCLIHEFYLGGEAGCEIDHHRPQNGQWARPDLISVYENLYWCCRECNQNKGDTWPSPEEYATDQRFLDPCRPEDDHEAHWETDQNGVVSATTPVGEYTIERLMLWRDRLVFLRRRLGVWQGERDALHQLLESREGTDAERRELEQRLSEMMEFLEPPTFTRPQRRS